MVEGAATNWSDGLRGGVGLERKVEAGEAVWSTQDLTLLRLRENPNLAVLNSLQYFQVKLFS